jgi:hypothetical protein
MGGAVDWLLVEGWAIDIGEHLYTLTTRNVLKY